MRRVWLNLLLTAIVFGCSSPPRDTQPLDPHSEAARVETTVERWFNSAFASLDTANIAAALTPTFEVVEGTLRMEREEFLRFIAGQIASVPGSFTIRYTLSDWDTQLHGDVAWTTFRNRMVLTPATGDVMNFEWLETAVLRMSEGRWLIDRYHSTQIERPAP